MTFDSFPAYRQMDSMDCGPTCLKMIARHYGKSLSLPFLREKCYLSKLGVSLKGICEGAESIGLKTLAVRVPLASSDERLSLSKLPLPAIVHWEQNHFVVVYKITKNRVLIADPGKGKVSYTSQEFNSYFSGGQQMGVVLLLETTPEFASNEIVETPSKGFQFLWNYLTPHRRLIHQMFIGVFLGTLFQLSFPFLTQSLVDIGVDQNNLNFIKSIEEKLVVGRIDSCKVDGFSLHFRDYSFQQTDLTHESRAVLTTFVGDYKRSLAEATLDQKAFNPTMMTFGMDSIQKNILIRSLKNQLVKVKDASQTAQMQKYIEVLRRPSDLNFLFLSQKKMLAIEVIVQRSKDFHFTLINEAHYNSQNRQFTKSLLQPLWDVGYRYLALETLSDKDSNISERGFPTIHTGYYSQDPVFGNLIREAIRIGYKLIPYDFSSRDDNLRDSLQAKNIFEKTYKVDSGGKVLVHAGYSHIFELGDPEYRPMGNQLKRLFKGDILTIDQVTMIKLGDNEKNHPYYKQASKSAPFDRPVVFVGENSTVLVDPVNAMGIDIQVYHPCTEFINGRPNWLLTKEVTLYSLPASLQKYQGDLFQVVPVNEPDEAIAVDQVVIQDFTSIALAPGTYSFRIVNRNGTLIFHGSIEAKK